MEIKTKKCKGNGKAIGYGCGELIPTSLYGKSNRTYGLGHSCNCFYDWLLNTKEGQDKIEKSKIKAIKKVKKESIKAIKKLKDDNTNWKNKTQTKVQEIARLVDFGLTCIATKQNGQIHGGHLYTKGGNQQMRFNLHNIHRQCAQSNHNHNDNVSLRDGIEEEYGYDYCEFIRGLKAYPIPNYTNFEYHEFYRKACKIANSLKKNKRVRTADQRISMRNEINKELGIYTDEQNVFNSNRKNELLNNEG